MGGGPLFSVREEALCALRAQDALCEWRLSVRGGDHLCGWRPFQDVFQTFLAFLTIYSIDHMHAQCILHQQFFAYKTDHRNKNARATLHLIRTFRLPIRLYIFGPGAHTRCIQKTYLMFSLQFSNISVDIPCINT